MVHAPFSVEPIVDFSHEPNYSSLGHHSFHNLSHIHASKKRILSSRPFFSLKPTSVFSQALSRKSKVTIPPWVPVVQADKRASYTISANLEQPPMDTPVVGSCDRTDTGSANSSDVHSSESLDGLATEIRDTMEIGCMVGFCMNGCEAELRKDTDFFIKDDFVILDGFVVVWGRWVSNNTFCGFINIYAPQSSVSKLRLWSAIEQFLNDNSDLKWVIMGDFNEVRYVNERKGSTFSFLGASRFNDFIRDSGLMEVRSGGTKFTRMSADGAKHSKLDRSDLVNFEPTYFKFFNSWLGHPEFNHLVLDLWNSSPSPIYCLPIKYFMVRIKIWKAGVNKAKVEQVNSLKLSLDSLDIKAENTLLSPKEIASRKDILMKSKALDEENVKDLKQKARLRWVVDGEENSSFFHGIVNSNRRSNFIHGISSNGVWVTDPTEVKQVAFNFFSVRFRSRWWWRFKLEHNHIWRRVIIALHSEDGGMNNLARNGRFPGLWRNILKIHKEYNSLNLPFADWFQRDQSSNGIDISWRWALTSHGNFSVSSMRAAYDDISLHQVSFRNSWWVNWVPSKINILSWRLLHKRLPTKINLAKRGVVCLSSMCPLCECAEEDEEHLFIGCSISQQLLKDLCKWWKVDIGQVNSIDNLLDRCSEVAGNFSCKKAFIGVVYGFFWIIWNLCNRKTFSVPSQMMATFLAGQLQAYSFFWFKNRVPKDVMANTWIEWCNSPMSCF
ncbi:Endonuclease/exonuclease/phosphatase [Cynara cardunculus var. scolymus]|uniref:Endonuclease/exonuclease/phosphatase n=1 Tax=Cynara cardunculus var. scolymus TaxID=59895 RepID=A0A118K1N9_CYNCS|nr:Endonuclease/exonuclease/phosphatase [Cynara cardunculus var. scolymus]